MVLELRPLLWLFPGGSSVLSPLDFFEMLELFFD